MVPNEMNGNEINGNEINNWKVTYVISWFQVIRWIHSAEGMLAAGFSIPGSLAEAEQLKKEHEQFQTAIEKTHASAVHVRQRSETLLNNNHYDPKVNNYFNFLNN